eukprot:1326552-Pyramimonas_sp.AAC.1
MACIEPPAIHCESYTHVLHMARHVYVYDACAAVSERVSYVGAQSVVHTYEVYDVVNMRFVCTSVCMRAA